MHGYLPCSVAVGYDPMLGRFTSPDSIVPDPGSLVGHNRYAYVYNNPIFHTDPSGYHPCDYFASDYSPQNCISHMSNHSNGTMLSTHLSDFTNWKIDHDGVNDPTNDKDYEAFITQQTYTCTEFASEGLWRYGIPQDDIWYKNSSEASAWNNTVAFYEYLTKVKGYHSQRLSILPPSNEGVPMTDEEVKEWFKQNGVPTNSIVFYDTDNDKSKFVHAATPVGGFTEYNDIWTPLVTDMGGNNLGVHSILNSQTYNDNMKYGATMQRPFEIEIVYLPLF